MRSTFLPLIIWWLLAAAASGHPILQNSMWVLFEPDGIRIAVNTSVKEMSVTQHLNWKGDGTDDLALLDAAEDSHGDYLLRHLELSAGGRVVPGRVVKITPAPVLLEPEQTFYQYELEYKVPAPLPRNVTFKNTMLAEFPYGPGQAWDLSYVMRLKWAGSEQVVPALLASGQALELPTGWDATAASPAPQQQLDRTHTFREYLQHGVMHILTGYDHLLFVAALVLATVSFWEMVKVIAVFTLAHTLTLTLSVLDLVRLPSSVVEPIIAASIVFVALENVIRPRRTHSWARLGVAFGFGLVHGLGFAGGLLEAMEGLPNLGIWIAIVAFSVGVEIGHQVVVLPLFGVLRLGRWKWDHRFSAPVLRYGSLLISVCGVYYFVHAVTAS